MRPKVLKNKPLVEAIFEAKWKPSLSSQSGGIDTDLRLFLGRFHDLVSTEYPAFEVLPAAAVPEQMTANLPLYRFRKSSGGWPLVQLGSGLLTLNETAGYIWEDYRSRALNVAELMFRAYPSKIELTSLELRYINAVHIDFDKQELLSYLEQNFRVQVSLPTNLFNQGAIKNHPNLFSLQTAFPVSSPAGSLRFSLTRTKVNDRDALVWETVFHSVDKQVPEMSKGFSDWLDPAHGVVEDWFFKLVDGDLLKHFA